VFRHRLLGEIGRILLQELGDGRCHISCEVVGDPSDPMTTQREAIFKPLGLELTRQMEAVMCRTPEKAGPVVQFGTAGGSVAWAADGKGVFYTRYPRRGEREEADLNFYQQVYYHELGTHDSTDRYEIGKSFPRIAEIELYRSPAGPWILAAVSNGDGGEYAHFVRNPDGKWSQVTKFEDGVKKVVFGDGDKLFLLSVKGAVRCQVLRIDLAKDNPALQESKLVVPEGASSAIMDIAASGSDLLVNDIVGGPSRLRHFDSDGHPKGGINTPDLSAVLDMVVTETGDFLLTVSSYTKPVEELLYAPKTDLLSNTAMNWQSAVDFNDIEEQRVFATSKDGTKIPISILMVKGTRLDGKNPTILYGLAASV